MKHVSSVRTVAGLALGCLAAASFADAPKAQVSVKPSEFSLEVRAFRGDEDRAYVSGALSQYFGKTKVTLSATGSTRGHFTVTDGSGKVIDYGGYDIELGAQQTLDPVANVTGYVGLAFANTPAQEKRLAGTARVKITHALGSGFTGSAEASTVLLDKNTLVGLGAGLNYLSKEGFGVYAKGTIIVAGDNARSTFDGNTERRALYEAGITYSPAGQNYSFSAGVTNILGSTTGFGLTPSLGLSNGLFVRVSGRM